MTAVCGVVLAAGEGQRLRPLTATLPKALCPVGNLPLLDHALRRLAGLGLSGPESVAVNAAYLAEQVRAHENALRLLKSQIISGEDAELTAFAQELLPTVESHLRMAYQLTGQEKKVESTPPPER